MKTLPDFVCVFSLPQLGSITSSSESLHLQFHRLAALPCAKPPAGSVFPPFYARVRFLLPFASPVSLPPARSCSLRPGIWNWPLTFFTMRSIRHYTQAVVRVLNQLGPGWPEGGKEASPIPAAPPGLEASAGHAESPHAGPRAGWRRAPLEHPPQGPLGEGTFTPWLTSPPRTGNRTYRVAA